jgi:hypothetical protein
MKKAPTPAELLIKTAPSRSRLGSGSMRTELLSSLQNVTEPRASASGLQLQQPLRTPSDRDAAMRAEERI